MSQGQYCQFKTLDNNECQHHLSEDTPIRFSTILGMYLCAEHEKFIIEDHINQFIEAKLVHHNFPTNDTDSDYDSDADFDQNAVYATFSPNVINRFISIEHYQHIPSELYINQCLYVYYVLDYTQTEVSSNILFYIRNDYLRNLDIGVCQLGSKHDADICVIIDISPYLIGSSAQFIQNYLERFIEDTQINFTQFIVNIPDEILTIGLEQLKLQFEQELDDRIQLGSSITNAENDDTLQNNVNQDIVDVANGRISTLPEPNRNEEIVRIPVSNVVHQYRYRSIKQLELTIINTCPICVSDEEQRGLQMSCCSKDNTICLDCVINQQILEHTKYFSVLNIKDLSIFSGNQNCFYCRNPNSFQNIINDNYFKQKFVEILQIHIQKELQKREQNHLIQIRSRLGL